MKSRVLDVQLREVMWKSQARMPLKGTVTFFRSTILVISIYFKLGFGLCKDKGDFQLFWRSVVLRFQACFGCGLAWLSVAKRVLGQTPAVCRMSL